MDSVFHFSSYRDYLESKAQSIGRGGKAMFAKAAGCQSAYLSQALKGRVHLNHEQLIAIAQFLDLSFLERDFLLALLSFERSGSKELRSYYEEKLNQIRTEAQRISKRIKKTEKMNNKAKRIYYSSWEYGAVHVSLEIEGGQSSKELSDLLGLKQSRVAVILEFLSENGLAKKRGAKFLPEKSIIHLDDDSSLINKHHTNWRIKAVECLPKNESQSIHYSSVISVSNQDKNKLHELILQFLSDARRTINESKPCEKVLGFNLDYFEL